MSTLANMPIHPFQELDASGMPRHQMFGGITLRQHYAGLAMQGLLSNLADIRNKEGFKDADITEFARMQADALIAELEKGQEAAS